VANIITQLKGEITETKLLFISMVSNRENLVPLSMRGERGQERYALKGLARIPSQKGIACLGIRAQCSTLS
jgi:hypothetical protein